MRPLLFWGGEKRQQQAASRKRQQAAAVQGPKAGHCEGGVQAAGFPTMSTSHAPIIIGGTIAIDHVKTPEAEASNLLGGSAAYAALAASFFSRPVALIGIIGRDFPQEHLEMLEKREISLAGVERSESDSFTWSGEYHANMNERTTHRVGLNVLESWQVKVPASAAGARVVVLANMSPDNQLEMLGQCRAAGDAAFDTE